MIFEYLISLPKIMSANIGIRALKMSAIQTTLWIMQPRQHNSEPRIEIKMITGLKSISLKSHHDRSKWVQTLLDNSLDNDNSNLSDMHLSSHATGLLLEALNAFCSGNWVATIILAQAVFDVDIAKNKVIVWILARERWIRTTGLLQPYGFEARTPNPRGSFTRVTFRSTRQDKDQGAVLAWLSRYVA